MRTKDEFLTLAVSLEGDFELLAEIQNDNAQALTRLAAGADHSLDLGAWGYTLHGAYNLLENYFLRISKFFENHLPADAWHQELLERMRLNLTPLRPALIEDRALFEALQDLRGFRHVFRHQYGSRLRRDRLVLVQKAFDLVTQDFPVAHARFLARIKAVSEALE